MNQVIYTLVLTTQASPTSPAVYHLNAYAGANGHLLFSRAVTGATGKLVATQHFLVIPAFLSDPKTQSPVLSLLIYDANGAQTRQITLSFVLPQQLLTDHDTVFMASLAQTVSGAASQVQFSAFNAATGATLWQKTLANATSLTPFAVVGQELVGNVQSPTGSLLTALDATSGTQVWQMPTNTIDSSAGNVVVGSDVVYSVQFTAAAQPTQKFGKLLVANIAATGAVRWSQPFTPPAANGAAIQVQVIAADQQAVYCEITSGTSGTNETSSLAAFAASDGHQLWNVPETASLSAGGTAPTALIAQGSLYGAATGQATNTSLGPPPSLLVAVNLLTGASRWHTTLAGFPLSPLVGAGGHLYLAVPGPASTATTNGQSNAIIAAFNATTGSPEWQIQTTVPDVSQLMVLA